MNQAARNTLSAACLVFAIACGDSGGGSGGGGMASSSARCPGICSTGQQQCGWVAADAQECEAQCREIFGSYPAVCQSKADAALSCASSAGVWDCNDGEPSGCGSLLEAFGECESANTNVDKAAYCSKCQSCFAEDPSFNEGFCASFWNGSAFDYPACVANGDVSEIKDKSLTSAALGAMSCAEFDDRI